MKTKLILAAFIALSPLTASTTHPEVSVEEIVRHSGKWAARSAQSRFAVKLSMYYPRGLAVCA